MDKSSKRLGDRVQCQRDRHPAGLWADSIPTARARLRFLRGFTFRVRRRRLRRRFDVINLDLFSRLLLNVLCVTC